MKIRVGSETIEVSTPKIEFDAGENMGILLTRGDDDEVILTFTSGDVGDDADVPLFIQDTAPVTVATKYLWIDTSGGDIAFWVENGA
jgi:hypothetical protein